MSFITHLDRMERFDPLDRQRIEKALLFSKKYHEKQRRVSGEPYIIHPVAVAQSLIDTFGADADTVITGLLHDTVEDTDATLDDVEREFGPVIRFLVDGTTDVGKGDGQAEIEDRTSRDAATHKKVEAYAAKDPRIFIVKIADRWHNMLSCRALRPKNQKRLALETLSFHVPAARKLGFASQADQLQKTCEDVIAYVDRWERKATARRDYLR
jgi:GTP diphosphokinase / guanosine-3',5'-bis(diphosphate) 3'-diphosphatase